MISVNDLTHGFYGKSRGPDAPACIIDTVNPETGRGLYSGETADEIAKRLGCVVEVLTIADALQRERAQLITGATEITAEQFDNWLNCMPPMRWGSTSGIESFAICEALTHDIHQWCLRTGRGNAARYWTFNDSIRITHVEMLRKLRDAGAIP